MDAKVYEVVDVTDEDVYYTRRGGEMTPFEMEKYVAKELLKSRIRNLERWGGGNTATTRTKELKEELKKLEEGENNV